MIRSKVKTVILSEAKDLLFNNLGQKYSPVALGFSQTHLEHGNRELL